MTLNESKNQYLNGWKHTKLKLNNYMSRPKNSCKTLLRPPNRTIRSQTKPLGQKKVNNNPKFKTKSNVRIEGNIENESSSTTWVDPKTVVKPYPLGPQKVKNGHKFKSKSNVSIDRKIQNKICLTTVLQYLSRLQNNLNLIPILKIAFFLPQKSQKNDPYIR